MRPCALSLEEILYPVTSLGMAWMVWYDLVLVLSAESLRLPAAARHHLDIAPTVAGSGEMDKFRFGKV